jgi:predicted DNA-binding transcriptional regulator YafY
VRLNLSERQDAIMDILHKERHTTTARLSAEFDVTERTIRNDITALSLRLPILTVRGRYGGGVKLADWFRPCAKTLSPQQEELLRRLKTALAGDDLIVLNSILVQFSPSHGCR